MTPKTLLPLALTLLALTPAGAAAATGAGRMGTLAAVGATFAWDGDAITGAGTGDPDETTGCTPGACDETLLKVGAPSSLVTSIGMPSMGAQDLDLYVYTSDATGKRGDPVVASAGATAVETTTYEVPEAGFYLVRVYAATAFQGTYKGTAKLNAPKVPVGTTGSTGPPPVDPPVAAPLPPAAPAGPAGASGAGSTTTTTGATGTTGPKRANTAPKTYFAARGPVTAGRRRVLKGTSADDGTVRSVRVGLVRIAGTKCRALTAEGTFKAMKACGTPPLLSATGTSAWSLKVPRLAKGSYAAYAKATDSLGLGGTSSKFTFTVR